MTDQSAAIARGLAFVDTLDKTERWAFLALFAGARFPWVSINGQVPTTGKSECQWVADWRDFYGRRLVNAGLFHFREREPAPALGGAEGVTYVNIDCSPTELGRAVREAWWKRRDERIAAMPEED